MATLRSLALGAFTSLAFSAPADAWASQVTDPPESVPSLSVPEQLHTATEALVNYSNPDLANQEVVIDIDDGHPIIPKRAQVVIQLDENGEGSGTWTPPVGWIMANFNAPDVHEESRLIYPPN